jgi:hypothetical protein
MKKFVLVVMMCCTFSAASNAIWLPAFFLRFVEASREYLLCLQKCRNDCNYAFSDDRDTLDDCRQSCYDYDKSGKYEDL